METGLHTMTFWRRKKATRAARATVAQGLLIRQEMAANWMAPSIRWYTPDRIEAITRDALAGDGLAQWALFDLMESTWPRLAKNLKQLKDAATSIAWSVQAWAPRGQTPDRDALARAAALEDAIWSMRPAPDRLESDFPGMLFDLADAWGKGISVVELDWEPRTLSDGKRYIAPRAAVHVAPHHYAWHDGRLWWRRHDGTGREILTEWIPDKFVIAICRHKSGPPAGAALLAPLAWFWSAANFAWEWWLNYAQLFGVPLRVAKYDPAAGPDVRSAIQQMLTDMGSAGWAALPAGTDLQILESAKSNAANPQTALVEAVDKICDLLILGQTLSSDVGDAGSYAAAKVHRGVLTDRERALCQWLSSVLQQLARAFCRLNWGDEARCPWFLPDIEEAQDAEAMARRDEILLRAGLPLPRQWLYDRHGIPAPGPDDDIVAPTSSGGLPFLGKRTYALHTSAARSDPVNADLDRLAAAIAPSVMRNQQALARHFLQVIEGASGPDEALQRLGETFADWDPTDLAVALEAAMQQAAARGLDLFAQTKWQPPHTD